MAEDLFQDDEAFHLADALIEKPLIWSRSVPAVSNTPVLSFVKFRAFDRAIKGYRSFVQLLKLGQWEDALILARSLYELDLNLSEISCSPNGEQAAKKFVRFGKFQQLHLDRQCLEDQLRDARLQPQPSAQAVGECEQKLTASISMLCRTFPELRKPNVKKWKWQDSWSGVSAEALAQHLAEHTGGRGGQSDYYVFRLASLFTHNTPGALLLALPQDHETMDWNEFRAALEHWGRAGLRRTLYEVSLCFVDIVGMAGDSIVGYERQWFDELALPLLRQFGSERFQ
jgi:hypothetical protein